MARPSSRLLRRTTTSRTTPVFAAETGSDTDNVDARDIVDGRVAEIGSSCQFATPNSQSATGHGGVPSHRADALVAPDCASSMK